MDTTPPLTNEEENHLVDTTIRFSWDYGVGVPLWADHGLLTDDPEWLERELGLSRELTADLVAWAEALEASISRRAPVSTALDEEEQRLVERVRAELAPGLTLVWTP